MKYTVKELANLCGVSVQSVYKLIRNNDELASICKASTSKQKGSVCYGADVLNWLLAYYKRPAEAAQEPQAAIDGDTVEARGEAAREGIEAELEALRAELAASTAKAAQMEAELAEARETINKLDGERQAANTLAHDLTQQNGQLLLMLSQAQNEVKLLSAPKETLLQRLKRRFTKNNSQDI